MKCIVHNLAVEYEDAGSGPVLLMLHGWKDDLRTFEPLLPFLKDWRVIRVDMPGFGKSEQPNEAWDVGQYAQFVADFLEKLKIEPEAILGHSFGGRVSIKGLAQGTFQTGKLILVASAGIRTTTTGRSIVFQMMAKVGAVLSWIPPFLFFRSALKKKLYAAAGSDYMGADALKETYLKTIREDLTQYAAQLSLPALLIWGKTDEQTPLSHGERFHMLIKDSRLVTFDAGHFVHREQPQKVADAIQSFLAA